MSIYLYLAIGVLLGACGSYVAEKEGEVKQRVLY